ncbi:MAG: translation initiation factor 2 [Oscillospiraceae bacterium]|jgi:hypothetical protein|nr:translation initiation factor 2 [Oscillospiraceae bacterium]
MVKGVTKRVIVIKSPDKKLFDEAIFIVRESAMAGVSSEDIIKQAREVANHYVRSHFTPRRFPRISAPLAAGAGAFMTALLGAIAWLFIR